MKKLTTLLFVLTTAYLVVAEEPKDVLARERDEDVEATALRGGSSPCGKWYYPWCFDGAECCGSEICPENWCIPCRQEGEQCQKDWYCCEKLECKDQRCEKKCASQGDRCKYHKDCCGKLKCERAKDGKMRCEKPCADLGEHCDSNGDCCGEHDVCYEKKCKKCLNEGDRCKYQKDCCGKLKCERAKDGKMRCEKPCADVGDPCSSNGDCCGPNNVCAKGECKPCSNEGGPCRFDNQCCGNLECERSEGKGTCKKPCSGRGEPCKSNADCCGPNNVCAKGECKPCSNEGDPCGFDNQCCDDLVCEHGKKGGRCKKENSCGKQHDHCGKDDDCCGAHKCKNWECD